MYLSIFTYARISSRLFMMLVSFWRHRGVP